MRLLDLFCGAGGCAVGYHRAGFTDIVGIDLVHQPRYPFAFVRMNAIKYLLQHGHEFDAIHASPPCQRYSVATSKQEQSGHPDLIGPCRRILTATGRVYVIENLTRSPLLSSSVVLCGSMFGMKVRRHRLFESNVLLSAPRCRHDLQPVVLSVTGSGYGGKHKGHGATKPKGIDEAREVMGVDWGMTIKELSQSIPPAYTEHIGKQLLAHLATDLPPS